MTTPPPRPVPDLDSAPFWAALTRHELLVQHCDACGELQFPFRPACTRCLAPAPTTRAVSGRARVLSWVITHRVFHPAFADRVPYTTVLVRLEEGDDLLLYGLWDGELPPQAEGEGALARFVDHEGFTLVVWAPET